MTRRRAPLPGASFAGLLAVALAAVGWWLATGDGPPRPDAEVRVAATSLDGPPAVAPSREAQFDAVPAVERALADAEPAQASRDQEDDEPAGTLVGHVVDAHGAPCAGWEIRAASDSRFSFAGTGSAGRFRFRDLPPDRYTLEAVHRLAPSIPERTVEVVDGRTTETTLVYDGPDVARRLLVRTVVRPVDAAPPDPSVVVLHVPDGGRRTGVPDPERGKTLVFDDVPPGPLSVTIDDPRFAPWRRDGVRPGRQVLAELGGTAAVVLRVVDGTSGERLERYALTIGNERTSSRVKGTDDPPPQGDLYGALVEGPVTLQLRCDGFVDREVDLPPLAAQERRTVRVALQRLSSIHGVVRAADGTPVVGARILVSGRPGYGGAATPASNRHGAFAVTGIEASSLLLQAVMPDTAYPTDVVSLEIPSPRHLAGVELRFPPAGVVRGAVLAGPGVDVDGLVLVAMQPPPDDWEPGLIANAHTKTTLGPDGTFELAPLPYGEVRLHLEMAPPRGMPGSAGGLVRPPRIRHDLGTVQIHLPSVEVAYPMTAPITGALDVVIRRHGRPATEVDVRVDCGFAVNLGADGTTGADGLARIGPLFPGPWFVRVRARNLAVEEPPLSQRVEVTAGRTTRVELDR